MRVLFTQNISVNHEERNNLSSRRISDGQLAFLLDLSILVFKKTCFQQINNLQPTVEIKKIES